MSVRKNSCKYYPSLISRVKLQPMLKRCMELAIIVSNVVDFLTKN